MEALFKVYKKLLQETNTDFFRYLYSEINWKNRIVGIRGPRGVGKTTLMLQHIKNEIEPGNALYVNADDIYFSSHTLLGLAEQLVHKGVKYFYIDEIHKYKDWSKELKLIYDYYSELNVVFSGSSVLDLNKGTSDLSRRAVVYHLYGLSFREYLNMFHGMDINAYTIDEIIAGKPEKLEIRTPLRYFEAYLKQGYYPFSGDGSFEEKLRQIVNVTLENDIPVFADMPASMGRKFKRLLTIISQSVPFKPNMSKLAEMIGAGRNQMPQYFDYIEDAGMIARLRSDTGGLRNLGKTEKTYLDNTNLVNVLSEGETNKGNMRETFFLNQTRVKNIVTSSDIADFQIGQRTFEVGGKSKGQKQILSAEEGYIVKDDIEYPYENILPLWWFGLNY